MIGAEANVPASTKFINVFEQMMEFNFLEFAGRLFEESADRGEDFFDGLSFEVLDQRNCIVGCHCPKSLMLCSPNYPFVCSLGIIYTDYLPSNVSLRRGA